jgi:phosphomevalonate kinase
VLYGAPAVVAAVDRRVAVEWSDEAHPVPPELEASLALARERCGPTPGFLRLDVSELHQDGTKLGLGSSAAAAVAAAGAVFATHGRDLRDPATRREVFDCAFAGHAAVAPRGSGVDVAASAFGGFLRFSRARDEAETLAFERPTGLWISLVWTGHAARTSELVAKVNQLRQDAPELHERRMRRLCELSDAFSRAFRDGDAAEVVVAAGLYGEALHALGQAAGAPIVEARLARASELAARFSGSAKPCGAGGGDVAIAFFIDSDAAKSFELACSGEGLHPIRVAWGPDGVRATVGSES